jgi:ABC-type sugar transport system ATPase subunit
VKAPSVQTPVRSLSGGNQQKVVLGRWFTSNPKIYILDEPTRGIDVGAKAEIYQNIGKLAERGAAALVISSELPELLGICDRILVMRAGRIVGEVVASEATEKSLLELAIGTTP